MSAHDHDMHSRTAADIVEVQSEATGRKKEKKKKKKKEKKTKETIPGSSFKHTVPS